MIAPTCRACGLGFAPNETVSASDWNVIGPDGSYAEVRYEHITCATPEPWYCDLHGVATTGDCAACDDELIEAGEAVSKA